MNAVFSVIILHYNQPKYWKSAVDSLLTQNYPYIQLIFSDDGTPGFEKEQVEEYIDYHKRNNILSAEILSSPQNVGTVKNLNRAHRHCTGKYILHFAADDALYDEHVLERFAKALDNTDEGICGVFAKSLDCDINLEYTGNDYISCERAEVFSTLTSEEQYKELIHQCLFHFGATAFLKKNLEKYLPFDEHYYLLEDWPFVLRVTRENERFIFAEFNAIYYRAGGVSRPLEERNEKLTYYICHDHLEVHDREIFPYTRRLTLNEIRNVIKKYDKDRVWMKKLAGNFESRKRIEILKSDWRFIIIVWEKLKIYQQNLLLTLGASILLGVGVAFLDIQYKLLGSLLVILSTLAVKYIYDFVIPAIKKIFVSIRKYLFNPYR